MRGPFRNEGERKAEPRHLREPGDLPRGEDRRGQPEPRGSVAPRVHRCGVEEVQRAVESRLGELPHEGNHAVHVARIDVASDADRGPGAGRASRVVRFSRMLANDPTSGAFPQPPGVVPGLVAVEGDLDGMDAMDFVQLLLAARGQEDPVGDQPRAVLDLPSLGDSPESRRRQSHHVLAEQRLAAEPSDVECTVPPGRELRVESLDQSIERLGGERARRVLLAAVVAGELTGRGGLDDLGQHRVRLPALLVLGEDRSELVLVLGDEELRGLERSAKGRGDLGSRVTRALPRSTPAARAWRRCGSRRESGSTVCSGSTKASETTAYRDSFGRRSSLIWKRTSAAGRVPAI